MEVLLVTFGSAGDVHPFLALGRALQGRGHRVTLMTDARFEASVRREALDFIGLPNPKTLTQTAAGGRRSPGRLASRALRPLLPSWSRAARASTLAPLIRPVYEAIARRCVAGRTVVVAGAPVLGARLAHEHLGVPLATVHLAPVLMRSVLRPPVMPGFGLPRWLPRALRPAAYRLFDRAGIDPRLAGPLNAVRAELGLPPVRSVLGRWRDSPALILGLYPDWFGMPQADWPAQTRLTGFPLYQEPGTGVDRAVSDFLDAGPPAILFTASSAMKRARDFFAQSVEACRRLGQRGLLLTRFADQLPPALPPTLRHVEYVPLGPALLSRVALVVHHGGIGTAAQALAAGVPQLIVPHMNDQPDNAERLGQLGVARTMAPTRYRAAAVAPALQTLLADRPMHERCRTLARRIHASRPIDAACRILETWAADPRRTAA